MEYQLVLQFEAKSLADFDQLVAFEENLGVQLGTLASVDGHDFGQEEFNLFLLTGQPKLAFERAKGIVKSVGIRNQMRAAYRELTGEDFVSLWPPGATEFSIS